MMCSKQCENVFPDHKSSYPIGFQWLVVFCIAVAFQRLYNSPILVRLAFAESLSSLPLVLRSLQSCGVSGDSQSAVLHAEPQRLILVVSFLSL